MTTIRKPVDLDALVLGKGSHAPADLTEQLDRAACVMAWSCPGGCEGVATPYEDSDEPCVICRGAWPAEPPRFDALGRLVRGTPLRLRVFGRITVTPTYCWEYSHRNEDGYGVIKVDDVDDKVSRVAWRLTFGEIPASIQVCHRCDNPPCCNPSHLFLGTNHDNVVDRHHKGRTVMPTNGPDHLRGRTHCPVGHPYAGDNLRRRPNGERRCAECCRNRDRRRRAASKETSR